MFPNGTIRVLSPITEDGNRPKLDRNGQRMWREDFFPATSLKAFERRNNRLPDHLKKKIEPVSDGDVAVKQPAQAVTAAVVVTETPNVVKKRGPKPKNNAQSN